jgi:hypothetical protein
VSDDGFEYIGYEVRALFLKSRDDNDLLSKARALRGITLPPKIAILRQFSRYKRTRRWSHAYRRWFDAKWFPKDG